MDRRTAVKGILLGSTAMSVSSFPNILVAKTSRGALSLVDARERIGRHFEKLRDRDGPYGAYRRGIGERTDLYASADVAIARHIMGESLVETLSETQRREWIDHINSYQSGRDGSYTDTFNHAPLHANGMVIGALGALGGRQRFRVKLYEDFDTVEEAGPWLDRIDWERQWSGSHLFWGGMHCFSLSSQCDEAWIDFVFEWLNANLDRDSGWWRKGVPHADRHQPLGGSVHILPMYEHHDRPFPSPERVIDSVIDLQLPNGRWLAREKDRFHAMHYLELDALYAFKYMSRLAPGYREKEIARAVHRNADLVEQYWHEHSEAALSQHPHRILSIVGVFGLLQNLLPERFVDDLQWSDIFSDIRLYNTKDVEIR